ncbi:transducin family protein / WD-40 repeat family protein [Klebsormidium nitens]|uniref:Transducin family protein / WD-40 repeat family protein n=1 Tax=Klebsormidium nitens TaxID=105231 RepID=A0A1Y1HVN4_KLENI|nr:transducin family protein / WD-40 repeat family protein [Klebsormidium nitens]|eukprot:GAQ82690.1 transducin family protein / WD-40 repeat family protein [Klebsormidium nitens]
MAAPQLETTHACLPGTERGRGILIAGDVKTGRFAYTNGRSVVLRSLENPLECTIYSEHAYATTVARFSPNGEWVASADISGQVRVWAVHGPEHRLKYELRALGGSVDDLQWSADGQRIVVCGDAKGATFVRAFTWDAGGNLGEFEGHSKRVLSCSFKPSRPFRIASCGEDFVVNYYEGPPFKFKTSHREHSNFVNCVRYSPDGTKFITVSSDQKGFVYDGATGEKKGELKKENGHKGSIYALSWSPDSKKILTVSADKTAKIWSIADDGSTGEVETTFSFAAKPTVEDMQVGCLWLNERLLTVSLSGAINYLDPAHPQQPARVISGHVKYVTALAVVPAKHGPAREAFSGSYDGSVQRWDLERGCLGKVQGKGHTNGIVALAVSPTSQELLSVGLDDTFRRTPLPAEQYAEAPGPVPLGGQPSDLDVAGDLAIVATANGIVLLRDGKLVSTTKVGYNATAAGLAPDGKEAAVGGSDGKVRVYRVSGDSLEEEAVLERHRGPIMAVRYSPDGAWIATADQNREAVVWHRVTREVKLKDMLYHTARISSIAWSPDSTRLATGSLDTNLLVWDVNKPASARQSIKGAHPGGVTAVAWLSNTLLLSAGDDACLRKWTIPQV